jgi:hypothetical protein
MLLYKKQSIKLNGEIRWKYYYLKMNIA